MRAASDLPRAPAGFAKRGGAGATTSDSASSIEAACHRLGHKVASAAGAACAHVRVLAVATILGGCAPTHSALRPPYSIGGLERSEAEIGVMAVNRCRVSRGPGGSLPPGPFTTDGCTLSPGGPWTGCCIEHDMAYWCDGATADRKRADRALQACVRRTGHPVLADLMYVGVRIGGARWFPLPWRWGYGYPWLRGSSPPHPVLPGATERPTAPAK